MLEIPTDNKTDSMRGGNGDMTGVINLFCGKHSGLDVSSRQFFGTVGQGQQSGVVWECSGEELDNPRRGERSFLLGHNRGHEPALARFNQGPKPPGGFFKLWIKITTDHGVIQIERQGGHRLEPIQ